MSYCELGVRRVGRERRGGGGGGGAYLNVNTIVSRNKSNKRGVGGVAVGAPLVPVGQALGGLACV